MICPRWSKQHHTAQCPAFEVRIFYPFHPRYSETVAVLGSKRHAGAEHFVIRQPDRTLALLPAWMTEPGQATLQIVVHPRFPVGRLADLRMLVDAAHGVVHGGCASLRGSRRCGAYDATGDLFEEVQATELRPELRSRLTPLLQALLTEAAQLERQTLSDDLGSAGANHD